MKKLLLATTALIAAASATSVFAADLIIEEPVDFVDVATSTDWSGAYIGAHVGYGAGTVEWYFTGGDPDDGSDYDLEGWLLGVQGGYNWQLDGGFVLGLEGDLSWADISGESPDFDPGDVTRSIDWTGSIRGRAGIALDSVLLYGTAGLAVASTSAEVFGAEDSNTHVGWTAGIGAEVLVTEDVSLRGEYRYSSYGDEEYDYDGLDITTGFDTHQVTVGLNFHF